MTPGSRHRPRLPLRLRVRVHRHEIDRQLSMGIPASLSPDHELRALQLVGDRSRAALARSLRRAVEDADDSRPAMFSAAVPVRRREVLRWREALLGLAERLVRDDAVNPAGLAQLALLLGDGGSPLYNEHGEPSLIEALWAVSEALQVCPPHTWGCPKVMKLDPEHVAWTCERCGAIATSDHLEVKPA